MSKDMSKETSDIDNLFNLWNDCKVKIATLEKKCQKYKDYCERLMNQRNVDVIKGSKYAVFRSNISRENLSKKDVPSEIWSKYSSRCNYPVFHLRENKG